MKRIDDRTKTALKRCADGIIEISSFKGGRFSNVKCSMVSYLNEPYAYMILHGYDIETLRFLVSVCNTYLYIDRTGVVRRVNDNNLMEYVIFTDGYSCDLNTHYVV